MIDPTPFSTMLRLALAMLSPAGQVTGGRRSNARTCILREELPWTSLLLLPWLILSRIADATIGAAIGLPDILGHPGREAALLRCLSRRFLGARAQSEHGDRDDEAEEGAHRDVAGREPGPTLPMLGYFATAPK